VRRREFITLVGGAAAGWPLAARAQQSSSRVPVVGVLWHAGSAEEEDVYLSVLVKAFNDLGYVEGKNIHLDHRFPDERPERFRTLAQELVDEKPDVIIAVTNLAALEVKRATSTIPIVVSVASDAVGMGLVESLARPGGNVTGLSLMAIDLSGKRLELATTAKALGILRFHMKYSAGTLSHEKIMRCIELYGRQVIPLTRDMLA